MYFLPAQGTQATTLVHAFVLGGAPSNPGSWGFGSLGSEKWTTRAHEQDKWPGNQLSCLYPNT